MVSLTVVTSVGPELVSLTGSETALAGETVSYTCSGLDSNPPSSVVWDVRDHTGRSVMDIVKVSQLSTTTSQQGWATSSTIEIPIPREGSTVGLHLTCSLTNPELRNNIVKEQTLAVQCKYLESNYWTGTLYHCISVICITVIHVILLSLHHCIIVSQ